MQQNKGQIIRAAIIGLALVAGAFLFIKLRKNKNPKMIYSQLKNTLSWPIKLQVIKLFGKTNETQYIYKSFIAGEREYRVFVWETGNFTIKEYDKKKTYPIFVSGQLEMIYPLILKIKEPTNRMGTTYKAKDMTALLRQVTGTKISYITKGKA